MGKQWKPCQTLFFWAPKSLQMVTAAMKLKDAHSLEGKFQTLSQKGNSIRPKHFGKSSTIKCKIVPKYAQRRVLPWSTTRLRGIRKNHQGLDGFLRILFTLYSLETLYPWHRSVLPPNPTVFLPFQQYLSCIILM